MCVYNVTSIQSKPSEIVYCFFRLSKDYEELEYEKYKFIRMPPTLHLGRMLWSSLGWFLIDDSSHPNLNRFRLFNPFADKQVALPSYTSPLNITDFALSSPPTSQDSVIVLKDEPQLKSDMNEVRLVSYKTVNNHWSSVTMCKGINTTSMAFYNGRLYALCLDSRDCLIFEFNPNIRLTGSVPFPQNHDPIKILKLVESNNDGLFLIGIGYKQVAVYKLDGNNQWVVVNDLGDQAIVMDQHRGICFSLGDEKFMVGDFKRNCVHFFDQGCYLMQRFSMKDGIDLIVRVPYGFDFKWMMPWL